ncbi:MAG: cupin domain-containing protein, partial [Deltaproteobacteria bacterium]|nr:cupin domain-containing protein [Deltaproteobacteria bacterium]
MPDGCVFKPHWHPQNVNVTVLSGGLGIGMGDKFDESKGRIVKTGGYILEPEEMHHHAWAQGPTIIEVLRRRTVRHELRQCLRRPTQPSRTLKGLAAIPA